MARCHKDMLKPIEELGIDSKIATDGSVVGYLYRVV
jgi:hypothetical protein